MIDMGVRVSIQMLDNKIDPSLKGQLFPGPVMPPKWFKYALTRFIDVVEAKQVLQTVFNMRKPFHIKKQIVGRGFRQPAKSSRPGLSGLFRVDIDEFNKSIACFVCLVLQLRLSLCKTGSGIFGILVVGGKFASCSTVFTPAA